MTGNNMAVVDLAPAAPMQADAALELPMPGQVSPAGPTFGGAPTKEEIDFALVGLPTPDIAAAIEPPSKPRKVVRFVESEREKVVTLKHPLECEDVAYERITVRRMTMKDIIAHFAVPEGDRGRWPCFFDARGEAVPDEVLDALSVEDSMEVNEALQHFFPASFRADPAP